MREGWESAQARAVARGVHTAPRVPTGYRRGDDGRLVPDPDLAPLVADAFRRRATGATYRQIAEKLSGEAGRYGYGKFRAASVAKLLKSPIYLGEARYGEYRNPAAHAPLVSRRLWLAAQSTAPNLFPHPRATTLLSGLVRCAGCSHLLSTSWTKRTAAGRTTRTLVSYGCRKDRKTKPCPNPVRVRTLEVETLVVDHFFTVLRLRRSRSRLDLDRIERELAAVELSLPPLSGGTGTVLGREESEVITDHANAEEVSKPLRIGIRQAAFYDLPPAKRLERLWPKMPTGARRRALGAPFDAIVVEAGEGAIAQRLHFVLAGEMPDDLPRQGKPGPTRRWSLSG